MSTILTHVVPSLWPQSNAVGDYALELAVQLQRRHGVDSRFVVCDPDRDGPSRVKGFVIRRLRVRSEAGIWSLLGSPKEPHAAVILHYSQLGYHRLGIPLWLYWGVRSWLAEAAGTGRPQSFHIVFHDSCPSMAPPWQLDHFLHKGRQWLARAFHRQSNLSIVCSRTMQAMLDSVKPNKTLWLPRPSSLPLNKRPRCEHRRNGLLRFAIAGSPGARIAAIRAHGNLLRTFDQKKLLGTVVLLGECSDGYRPVTDDVDLLQKRVQSDRIEVVEATDPQTLSNALGNADLLLSNERGAEACNSGSFMAALSTGCPSVLPDGTHADPLIENKHFVTSDDTRLSLERLERMTTSGQLDRIAEAGQMWYDRHADWAVIAQSCFNAVLHSKPHLESAQSATSRAMAVSTPRPVQSRPRYQSTSKVPHEKNLPVFGQAS